MNLYATINEIEKVKRILAESVDKKDKKLLNDIVSKKKSGKYTVDDISFTVKSDDKTVVFSYGSKNTDSLTFALTDLSDARGLEFDYKIINGKIIFVIEL